MSGPSVYFLFFVGNYIQTSADDVIISQSWAISQLFASYPPSGAFCQVSKLTIQTEHGRLWEKIGPKSLGHTGRDICKDEESNLGPVAGY